MSDPALSAFARAARAISNPGPAGETLHALEAFAAVIPATRAGILAKLDFFGQLIDHAAEDPRLSQAMHALQVIRDGCGEAGLDTRRDLSRGLPAVVEAIPCSEVALVAVTVSIAVERLGAH